MNPQTERDLRIIYGNNLNPQMLNRLIDHLRTFWKTNQAVLLPIKTRKDIDEMEMLGYFSVFHKLRSRDIVLFAGGIEEDKKDNDRPFSIIRIDEHNLALRLVTGFTFDYRKWDQKTNRVCVKLREETIDALPIILWCQLQWFTDNMTE